MALSQVLLKFWNHFIGSSKMAVNQAIKANYNKTNFIPNLNKVFMHRYFDNDFAGTVSAKLRTNHIPKDEWRLSVFFLLATTSLLNPLRAPILLLAVLNHVASSFFSWLYQEDGISASPAITWALRIVLGVVAVPLKVVASIGLVIAKLWNILTHPLSLLCDKLAVNQQKPRHRVWWYMGLIAVGLLMATLCFLTGGLFAAVPLLGLLIKGIGLALGWASATGGVALLIPIATTLFIATTQFFIALGSLIAKPIAWSANKVNAIYQEKTLAHADLKKYTDLDEMINRYLQEDYKIDETEALYKLLTSTASAEITPGMKQLMCYCKILEASAQIEEDFKKGSVSRERVDQHENIKKKLGKLTCNKNEKDLLALVDLLLKSGTNGNLEKEMDKIGSQIKYLRAAISGSADQSVIEKLDRFLKACDEEHYIQHCVRDNARIPERKYTLSAYLLGGNCNNRTPSPSSPKEVEMVGVFVSVKESPRLPSIHER